MSSIKYLNLYTDGLEGWDYDCPLEAEINADTRFPLACRKMKIGGHWHRPPVGMKASEASHKYRYTYRLVETCLVPNE